MGGKPSNFAGLPPAAMQYHTALKFIKPNPLHRFTLDDI